MKKILQLLNFENLKNICLRFPILVVIIIIASTLTILDINGSFIDNFSRIVFSLIIVFFLSLGVYITTENYNLNYVKKHLYQIFPILFGVLFYIYFKNDVTYFRDTVFFATTMFGIISYIFFAAFLKKDILNQDNDKYFSYFYKISVIFLTSAILGLVLYGLGAIGINAVITLFDLELILNSKFYGYWAVIALMTITPLIALYQVPQKEELNDKDISLNSFVSFLVKYIAIPFIYIYFIILYLYTLKVLLNFGDWPKGEVSWLVIFFSTFGYIIYVFSYPFREKNKYIKLFRNFFPFVVIPQIFMLFYAIYIRIEQYDLTINRYLVVIFGIWLLIISFYIMFSKKKFLGFIPMVLTLFTIIISVGPWSVYNLPETRQFNSLKENLEQINILVNGEIILPEKDVSPELGTQIYSQISYLCNTYDCEKIKMLFEDVVKNYEIIHKENWEKQKEFDMDRFKNNSERLKIIESYEYIGPSNWEIIEEVTKKIKVKNFYDDTLKSKYIYINSGDRGMNVFPLDIQGYEKIYQIFGDEYKDLNEPKDYVKIDVNSKELYLFIGDEIITAEISEIIDSIYNKYSSTNNSTMTEGELTFEIETENYEVKLILNSISILNPEYTGEEDFYYSGTNGYALIKEKSFD